MLPLDCFGGQSPEDTTLRIWEDTYGVGATLRRLRQAHLPYDDGGIGTADYCARRPDNIKLSDPNARDASAPDFSDELIDMLEHFEYDFMEFAADINELGDPLTEIEATSQWIVDVLYPAARDRVEAYRNPPGRKPDGYFTRMVVSWSRLHAVRPFRYNVDFAAAAGDDVEADDDDTDHLRREDPDEFRRMQKVGWLKKWDDVKPPYQLRSLEFSRPLIKPLNNQPPAADGGSDDSDG